MSGCFEWPCIFKFNVHGHKKHLPSCCWAQQIFFTLKRGNSILKTCIYVYSQHWYLQWRTIIHSELSIKSDMEQHDVAVFQIGWISVLKQPVVCDLMRLFASRSLWQLLASYSSYSAYTLRATTKTTTTETSKTTTKTAPTTTTNVTFCRSETKLFLEFKQKMPLTWWRGKKRGKCQSGNIILFYIVLRSFVLALRYVWD